MTDVVTIGDLIKAAKKGIRYLKAYISRHERQALVYQLEEALDKLIRLEHIAATMALLQYRVNLNGYTLKVRPLWTALKSKKQNFGFCQLLIALKVDVNIPGILKGAIRRDDVGLL
jgi:hypothetical protein